MATPTPPKTELLRKMLAKEAAEGFLDKAVIGGLDSFLTRHA